MVAVAILPLGCGGEEGWQEVGTLQQAYKHPPPPGPPPYHYVLTSYGGPGDPGANGTPACGGKKVDGSWYYSTGAYSFGCGSKLRLRANGKCVVVKVVDNGPAEWVETKAKNKCGGTGYVIDASPLVSKHLYGTSSAGWSDCFAIEVTPIDSSAPTGPVACEDPQPGPAEPAAPQEPAEPAPGGFIGDGCGAADQCDGGPCFVEPDGFPGGMCTQPCDELCPDRPGKPVTFCITVPWGNDGFCHSRCDWEIHPQTGCREGYACVNLPRHNQPQVRRNVCVPGGGTYSPASTPASLEGEAPNPEHTVQGGCSFSGAAATGLSGVGLLLMVLMVIWRGRQ